MHLLICVVAITPLSWGVTLLIEKDEFGVTCEGLPNFCNSYGRCDHSDARCPDATSPLGSELRAVNPNEEDDRKPDGPARGQSTTNISQGPTA